MNEKKKPVIEPDDVVEKVVPNPASPEARRMAGAYLGKGRDDEHWRLYRTDTFEHYLEFRKDDTLHAERLSTGRVIVWVKPGTTVRETRSRSAAVEFLDGSILRENLNALRNPPDPVRRVLAMEGSGCSAASCFTTAGPNCPGPEHPQNSVGYTCGC